MTYLQDAYSKFRANPRNAPLAANVSLIYVPSTTRIDGADAIASHTSRQNAHLRKKSENIISKIESSDSLCLDIETTIEFLEGGGAYLPSFDDNFLADRVVTFPTLHIVHFNAEHQIQQVRIYWDQGSLLKELEVIGARGRNWPIRQAQEQTRLLKAAAIAKDAAPSLEPFQGDLPARPASPGKRHIRDPYAAASLTDLLSPTKDGAEEREPETRRPSSPSKRHTRDPYGQGSLTEILSPSKPDTNTVMRPYGTSHQPARRDLGDIFVADDGEPPATPSKAEKVISPKGGSQHQGGNRLFGGAEEHDEHRSFYKSDPRKYDHFEIGANEGRPEDRSFYKSDPRKYDHFQLGAAETPETKKDSKPAKFRNQSQWDFGDFSTPAKSTEPAAKARGFGYTDEDVDPNSPPRREAVVKARPDQSAHFDINDDVPEDNRIISSFGNRGQTLYENRLYDEDEATTEKRDHDGEHEAALGVTSNKANLNKTFGSQWEMHDDSPGHKPSRSDNENPKPLAADRSKAVKALEAHWDYSDSPQPSRTATSLHNPKTHNQPSWNMQDEASPVKPATSLRNPRTHNQPSWSMGGEE